MLETSRLGPMVAEESGLVRGRAPAALLVADVATCLLGVGMLVGMCLARSPQKMFWTDEVLTLVMVHETTPGEMFAALKDTINAMPPAYFTCIWLWSQAFGTSDFALRMFSCLGMCLAWFFCWRLLRTFCSRPTAATASLAGMFITKEVLYNNVDARCYSMYLAAYMAASLFFILSWGQATSRKVVIGAFLAHATLVTTHYIGCIYSAALILSSLAAYATTRWRGLRSHAIGASLGSAMFGFCIPFYLAQRSLGGEDNWLQRPSWAELARFVVVTYPFLKLLILVVIGFYAATLAIVARARPLASADPPARDGDTGSAGASSPRAVGLVVLCSVSFLLPIAIWVDSRLGLRLFMGRYFLPSFVVWPCVLGLALERLALVSREYGPRVGGRAGSLVKASPWTCCGAVAILALVIGLRHQSMNDIELTRSMRHISATIHDRGLDFVTADAHVFFPVWNYGGRSTERMKYVPLAERKGDRGITKRTEIKIFDTLERHFWPGVILTPERLRTSRMRCLMLVRERDVWIERGTISEEFQVVEDIGDGLVVVER